MTKTAPDPRTVQAPRPPGQRFHGLDTLRSVAIVSVVVYHLRDFHGEDTLPAWLSLAASQGWMGVDLFFVLSGYLISMQFLKPYGNGSRPEIWSFYRNRLYRVLPAYAVVLALYLAWPNWRESPNLPPLWEFLTFTQNLFANFRVDHAFSHVWSLCVEEHFYLLLPLIVIALMRKPSVTKTCFTIGGLVVFGICVRGFILFHVLRPMEADLGYYGPAYMQWMYYPSYCRLDGLLSGVTLGLLRTFRPALWSALTRRGHTLLLAGLACTALDCWLSWSRYSSAYGVTAVGLVFGPPILSLGLASIVASALSSNGWLRLKIPGAQLLATLAYTIYLTSKEFIHLIDQWFPSIAEGHKFQWHAAYIAACLLASGTLYLCIERPFLKLRDRRRLTSEPLHSPSL